jgi:hypothetical protein
LTLIAMIHQVKRLAVDYQYKAKLFMDAETVDVHKQSAGLVPQKCNAQSF